MKKISLFFVTALAVLTVSCDKDFESINQSPNDSQVTDPNLLLASTIISTQNVMYNAQVGGDMGLCWAQHWSKVQYNDEEKYIPRRALMNSVWTSMYASVIGEAKAAYVLAGDKGNTNLQAAALVMQANAFQILTDVFGPVPFVEAGVPGNFKPAYDSQEDVYDGIIALLDEAEMLFASGEGDLTVSSDLLYGGDVTKWRKLAASLKLKALMRISKVRNVSADVQALVDSGMLMSSNDDSAQLAYTASQPDANPIYETIVYSTRKEYKMSSVLIGMLNSLNDPRLPVFAQVNNSGVYVGNTPGIEDSSNYNAYSSPGTFYLNPELPGVMLSYAQVELYLAEAINEGIITGTLADARAHYVNGINANFEFNELSASPAYTGSASVDFSTQAEAREKIATQMWLALYGQGIEAWTEWRRTGYPALSPVQNAAISAIPRRFYYSTDEQNFNQASYAAAVATLDQGDTMLSKVWWMN
ncbi:MAG: SusD/RagB family nutrient-binding outer membrane lipoprotein [Flavobacteriaceae bacterium]|nr:SusD/RagB family nutrient-binding outer membrane lipoprotein [Flavobacteriaceae bacterium]